MIKNSSQSEGFPVLTCFSLFFYVYMQILLLTLLRSSSSLFYPLIKLFIPTPVLVRIQITEKNILDNLIKVFKIV